MSKVEIGGLTKAFRGAQSHVAVDDLDLAIEPGEFLVLLGPSGCGKTTTLRCLAGLESPDSGVINIGGQSVFDSGKRVNTTPDKRNIGMVFQSYALWPHKTVRKNIGYPLKVRKMNTVDNASRVEEVADLVDCKHLLDRYPAQLSGGQQQRIALARALAARPELILFDEPLSNLDSRLRDQVRAELHQLHRERPFTAVFVTHDQTEALSLGSRMAIMNAGRIEQIGTPEEVFSSPRTEYVADFIGMTNRMEFRRSRDTLAVGGVDVGGHLHAAEGLGSHFVLRSRPEDLRVDRASSPIPDGHISIEARVRDVGFGGRHLDLVMELEGHAALQVKLPLRGGPTERPVVGDLLNITLDPRSPDVFFKNQNEDSSSFGLTGVS